MNRSPQIGPCTISPQSGTQYSTIFSINCQKEAHEDRQLTYELLQNGSTVISSFDSSFSVRLSASENLKVKVQDALGSSVVRDVQVTLSIMPALNSYKDINEFLIGNKNTTGLANLIQTGDFDTATAMIRTAVEPIRSLEIYEEKHSFASQILENLNSLELNKPVQLAMLSDVMCAISKCVPVDHRLAQLNSVLLNRFAIFLDSMSVGLETTEQRIIEEAAQNIVETLSNLIQPFDNVDVSHDYNVPVPHEYPFAEQYDDYVDLDNEVVDKTEHLLSSTESIHTVMQSLSNFFANAMEPDEPTLIMNYGNITTVTYVKSGQDAGDAVIESGNNETRVVVSDGYLRTNGFYGRELKFVVSSVLFQQNPFWWFPEPNRDDELVMLFVRRGGSRLKAIKSQSRRRVSTHKDLHIFILFFKHHHSLYRSLRRKKQQTNQFTSSTNFELNRLYLVTALFTGQMICQCIK